MLPQISIVFITHNEERNIERALVSVRGLSDDIVVVDSGSVDRTVAICRAYGARVIEHVWEGYALSKNFGNQQARHPWILSLDADEELSAQLKASIVEQFHPELPENTVFSFNRLTRYCGKWIRHSGWYPDRKIRIWHRDFGLWEGGVHETIRFAGAVKEKRLKGDLLHYSFYTIEEHWQKIGHFTTLSAEMMYAQGKRASTFRLLLAPCIRFLRDFFFRGGFLDGATGFHVCRLTSWGVYLKYAKLKALNTTAHP